MRLSVALLALTVLLVAGFSSAGTMSSAEVPDEVKASPPPGTYWSEELGVFVFDPPVTLEMPKSNLLTTYEHQLYYDDCKMYYAWYQQPDYRVIQRFAMPVDELPDGHLEIHEIWLACVNDPLWEPDAGQLIIASVEYPPECPRGRPGEVLLSVGFVGNPWQGPTPPFGVPPTATWTFVTLEQTVILDAAEHPEFFVIWDYTPSDWGDLGGFYISGNPDIELLRWYEWYGEDCPTYTMSYGPWVMHLFANEVLGEYKRIDIKPRSCPNPLFHGDLGDVCVAIVGTGPVPLSVANIDTSSFQMIVEWRGEGDPPPGFGVPENLYPYKWGMAAEELVVAVDHKEDGSHADSCECTTEQYDGKLDFGFHFENWAMYDTLCYMYGTLIDKQTYTVEFKWLEDVTGEGGWEWQYGYDCFMAKIPGLANEDPYPGGSDPTLAATRVGDARGFALYQNAPNPFRGETTVRFSIPSSSHTTLTVHDVSGRTIATLVDGGLSAGTHAVEWDAAVPSGVYFCRLVAGGETAGTRMVVAR